MTSPTFQEIGARAQNAARILALASAQQKTDALQQMAAQVRAHAADILAANAQDVAAASALSPALIDRLTLTPARLDSIAASIEQIAAIEDPVGRTLASWTRPNGMTISRVAVPLGVIGIIYESRPNVTADAGALCLRAGNACILRGGSESFNSSRALHRALQQGLAATGLPLDAIQMADTPDRAFVGEMLAAQGLIDVIIPRGGKSLVARVQADSRVPVLAHLEGNNHVYVHEAADKEMAINVTLNAKLRRTGICGAAETLLIDRTWPHAHRLLAALLDQGCALRGDAAAQALDPRLTPATDADWATEYLDAIMAVKQVDGQEDALAHIARYSTHHTEAIITNDMEAARRFTQRIDSAAVLVNASTRFHDGYELGLGGEIGISTDKFHARGPCGLVELTSYKYVITGSGHVRP
jgi:glutamate-5-semialdehyde dehydrogenase